MTIEEEPLEWSVVRELLPPGWQQRAIEMRLVRPNLPAHMGTKVKDIEPVLRLVLYKAATDVGLETATAAFAAGDVLEISSVGLHKWMKKLGPYLEELVTGMVDQGHSAFAPERWAGYELVGTDATCVQRPGAIGTTARVHSALRLTDLRLLGVQMTDHKGGETFRRFEPEAGQLWIGDRGYANPPGVGWVKDHEAEVLVRYNRGSLPLYDAHGQAIDVLGKVGKLCKAGWTRQWQAFVHLADGKRIQGRLCAVRLPQDKAREARERLRREQGAELTAESLEMADFVVVFTTVPVSKLEHNQVLELYRLRWQIELDYKRDKSITGLNRLPNFLAATIESWIYAKLLLNQLLRKLADSGSAVSPCALRDAIGPGLRHQAA